MARNPARSLVSLALLLAAIGVAHAATGTVVFRKSSCDYYVVETITGYAVLEWYGGNDPAKGDVLAGDFESYGMKEVFNLTADSETQVWVEEYWLSRRKAIEVVYTKCS